MRRLEPDSSHGQQQAPTVQGLGAYPIKSRQLR